MNNKLHWFIKVEVFMKKLQVLSEKLNLILKPKVVKINPLAFFIVCLVIAIVGSVLLYSVMSASHHDDYVSQKTSEPIVREKEKLWYEEVNTNVSRAAITNSNVSSNQDALKYSSPDIKLAMDSPIKAAINGLSTSEIHTQNSEIKSPAENHLSEKENFLRQLSQSVDDDILHEPLKKPISPYIVQAGTLIPATLAGGIHSELPGQLIALVNQNVYDSIQGRFLIIPQGAKLILTYDANVAYGQERLLVAVKRIIFPNGNSMDLAGMPAVDIAGQAGFHDQVDNHYSRIFGSAAMMGLISGGFQLSQSQGNTNNNNPTTSQVMAGALGQQIGQVAMGMMNKNLEIAPTLIIRPGYEFNVQVTKDLIFPGPY